MAIELTFEKIGLETSQATKATTHEKKRRHKGERKKERSQVVRETKVIQKCLNPEWNEDLVLPVDMLQEIAETHDVLVEVYRPLLIEYRALLQGYFDRTQGSL